MTSQKIVAYLLLLIGVLSAFNVSNYLYQNEQNATITYTNFTFNATQYSLVKINNLDSFLLKNTDPVTDQSEIQSTLNSYYLKTFYPSDDEINTLKSLVKKFNDSRNDGYDFKGKEEYLCRHEILLSDGKLSISGKTIICKDNESCAKNAMMLFSIYGDGLGLGSPTVLLQPLLNFTPSSLRIDDIIQNYSVSLSQLTPATAPGTINYIKNTTPELKTLSYKIESTVFRTPRLNDSADRKACTGICYAICPSFDLDQAAIDQISTIASNLSTRLTPLQTVQNNSLLIYNRTIARMDHVKSEDMATYYRDIFNPLNQSGSDTIAMAQDALKHVQNKTLSSKLDDLKSLYITIPEDISNRNFTTTDSDITQYKKLINDTKNASAFLLNAYNETRTAKNVENSLIIVLESKDLDPVSTRSLELLKSQSDNLDAYFHDGITLAQLAALKDNYTNLTEQEQNLILRASDTPSTAVLLVFRDFARKVNVGIAQVADQTNIPKDSIQQSSLPLALFSAVIFISFASLALVLFLHIFALHRFRVPKTGHILGAAFLLIMVLLLVMSIFMFLFLRKTATDATLPEFLTDLSSKNNTTIFVDLRNTSLSDSEAMRSCGNALAQSISVQNKTWSIYTLTSSTCTQLTPSGNSSLTASDCLKKLDSTDSSFVLSYAVNNTPPKFSIIYQNKAEIAANLDYYQSCPLVALFS